MPNAYETVIQQANIRDILSYYNIDSHGSECLCPFHNDNHPSMHIDSRRNIVKCFSCGEGGNAISFIKKYENKVKGNYSFSTIDAIKKAAEICNIEVDASNLKSLDNKESKYTDSQKKMLEDNAYFAKLFNYNLSTANGKQCVEYLQSRKIPSDIIKEMQLGFSDEANFKSSILERFKKVGITDSRMKNRLMIPIADERGNIVAFSGRALHGEEPKYLLIPETEVFHKSDILFNLDKAKRDSYQKEIYIVEGFMDVIGAKKMGINNTVALMGTAITSSHIELLKKLKCDITLALDNDDAGKRAMINQIPALLNEGFNVSVIDISKIGNYKDFGDVGNAEILSHDKISSYKVSAIQYLMENKYLLSNRTTDIRKAYEDMKADGLIKNKSDEIVFIDIAMLHNPNFTKDEYYDLIHPVEIEKPKKDGFTGLRDKLLMDYFLTEIGKYVSSFSGERVIREYLKKHQREISVSLYSEFIKDPNKYIKDLSIDFSDVIMEYLQKDEEYKKFKENEYFPYEKSFKDITVFSEKGYAKLKLNENQKELLIQKFNENSKDMNSVINGVEELYVLNSLTRLNDIFPKTNDNCTFYIENILRQNLIRNQFGIFPYNMAFDKGNINYIDSKYKTADGTDYKSVLLFWDMKHELHLTNDNIVKNEPKRSTNEIVKENIIINGKFAHILIDNGYIKVNKKNLKISDNLNYELKCPSTYKFSIYSNKNKFVKQVSPAEIAILAKQYLDKNLQHSENNLKKKNDLDIDKEIEI